LGNQHVHSVCDGCEGVSKNVLRANTLFRAMQARKSWSVLVSSVLLWAISLSEPAHLVTDNSSSSCQPTGCGISALPDLVIVFAASRSDGQLREFGA